MPRTPPRQFGSEEFFDKVEELLVAGIEEFGGDWDAAEQALIARHPKHSDTIRRRVAALREEGWLLHSPGPEEGLPSRLGDFRLVRRLGAGGMGVVFLAVQEPLGRPVALKILPRAVTLDRRFLERFHREAQAAARLQHPGIVPVFGVGECEGVHWYAMQYVDGIALDELLAQVRRGGAGPARASSSLPTESLAERLATALFRAWAPGSGQGARGSTAFSRVGPLAQPHPGPPSKAVYPRSAANLALQVCHALSHAHAQGVLHRDIKPSNLLLDAEGRVWVTDFGLCKAEGAADLTQPGDLVGTLHYMAPEQLSGNSDARSEVYSVGATLYELLTLRPPFDDPSRSELIRQITEREPLPPGRIEPDIPQDLETIVLTALRKDPASRYQTAEAMAQDLEAFLEGRPIAARRPSALYYVRLAIRRNRALAATVGAGLLTLLAMTAVYVAYLQNARIEAEQARDEALWRSYLASISAAESAIQLGDIPEARQRLLEAPAVLRGWEWRHYRNRLDQSRLTASVPSTGCVVYAPGGEALYAGSDDFVIRELDPETGAVRRELTGHRGFLHDLDISPDGRWLASAGSIDDSAGLWDLRTGVVRFLPHPHEVHAVAFVPGLSVLAVGCDDSVVHLWSLDSAVEIGQLVGHRAGIHALACSPDGTCLASGSWDRTVRIWDPRTGQCLGVLDHDARIQAVVFDRSGERLLTGDIAGVAHVWQASSGRELFAMRGHRGVISGVAWSPSGTRLATASTDDSVRLWDAATGALLVSLLGHGDLVFDVAFAPDSSTLASVGRDGSLRLWDAETQPAVLSLRVHLSQTEAMAVSPDGGVLATGGRYGIVCLWDLQTALQVGAFVSHPSSINALAFDPTGQRLAVGGVDCDEVKIWDLHKLECEAILHTGGRAVLDLAFDRAGSRLIAVGDFGALLYGLPAQRVLRTLPKDRGPPFCCVALDSRCALAAIGTPAGAIELWDLATGRSKTLPASSSPMGAVAFARDGALLALADDGQLTCWDVESDRLLERVRAHSTRSRALAIHPDGERLATGSTRGEIKLWSYPGLRPVAVLRDTDRWVQEICFDPTGHRLLMAGEDQVSIWNDAGSAANAELRRRALSARTVAEAIVPRLLAADGETNPVDRLAAMGLSPEVFAQGRALLRSRISAPDELWRRAWRMAVSPPSASPPLWSLNVARALTERDPSTPRNHALLGLASYRLGKWQRAQSALRQAHSLCQREGIVEPPAWVLVRIMIRARAGEVDAATRELEDLQAALPAALDHDTTALLREARDTLPAVKERKG